MFVDLSFIVYSKSANQREQYKFSCFPDKPNKLNFHLMRSINNQCSVSCMGDTLWRRPDNLRRPSSKTEKKTRLFHLLTIYFIWDDLVRLLSPEPEPRSGNNTYDCGIWKQKLSKCFNGHDSVVYKNIEI